MVESEAMPTQVNVVDDEQVAHGVKDFAIGQNSMLIRDENDDVYMVG